jgi:hypothetical protein
VVLDRVARRRLGEEPDPAPVGVEELVWEQVRAMKWRLSSDQRSPKEMLSDRFVRRNPSRKAFIGR